MDAVVLETLKSAGWPWDRLSEAVHARQEAERLAADVLGDRGATPSDRAAAALELEEALGNEGDARDELAGVFLLLLQSAIARRPEALYGHLMAAAHDVMWKEVVSWLASTKPGGAEQWLEMSRRVAAAEEEAEQRRRECWRLALAVTDLQSRLEEMERKSDAARPQQGSETPSGRRQQSAGSERGGEERQAG